MADYYRLLGLWPDASEVEVMRAGRRYARHATQAQWQAVQPAVQVLTSPRRRAAYDAARHPTPPFRYVLSLQENLAALQQLLHRQRIQLANQQGQLERQHSLLQSERAELQRVNDYHEELEEQLNRQFELRRRTWWALAAIGGTVAFRLFISLFNTPSYFVEEFMAPYAPVAEAKSSFFMKERVVYDQTDQMPQFKGGLQGWQRDINRRLIATLPSTSLRPLISSAKVQFVVDSAGYSHAEQVLGTADTLTGRLLLRLATESPRFVPGYRDARPVAVRLRLPLD
jgi:curved DNA-binding protein CbpA